MDASHCRARISIGIRRHRAGVQHNDFGVLHFRCIHAELRQLLLNGCAVSLRRSAPKINDVVTAHRVYYRDSKAPLFTLTQLLHFIQQLTTKGSSYCISLLVRRRRTPFPLECP